MFNFKGYEFNRASYGVGRQAPMFKTAFKTLIEAEAYFVKQLARYREENAKVYPSSFTQKMTGLHGEGCYIPTVKEPKQLSAIWLSYCGNAIRYNGTFS